MIGVIMGILFLLVIGLVSFLVYRTIMKTDPKNIDTSRNIDIETAQEFLPFKNISDGVIDLGGHKYRAIIETTSTNYNLKTDREKELIEMSFQRFLNSLTFPVTFFIHTKVVDNTRMLKLLEEEVNHSLLTFPQLEEYANVYMQDLGGLNEQIGNNKQKKKYIIVPYEEAVMLPNLSEEEKKEYSLTEIETRASVIMDGLSTIGVKATMLGTKDLVEAITSIYHKEGFKNIEQLASKEYLSLITESDSSKIATLSEAERLDWILYEAQMKIQSEGHISHEKTESFIAHLDKMRDVLDIE